MTDCVYIIKIVGSLITMLFINNTQDTMTGINYSEQIPGNIVITNECTIPLEIGADGEIYDNHTPHRWGSLNNSLAPGDTFKVSYQMSKVVYLDKDGIYGLKDGEAFFQINHDYEDVSLPVKIYGLRIVGSDIVWESELPILFEIYCNGLFVGSTYENSWHWSDTGIYRIVAEDQYLEISVNPYEVVQIYNILGQVVFLGKIENWEPTTSGLFIFRYNNRVDKRIIIKVTP